MTSPRLSAEQRRALTLLASIPHGRLRRRCCSIARASVGEACDHGAIESMDKDEQLLCDTSFDDTCVFVRYGADTGSRATRREDLDWLEARPNPRAS
jgi:hypothetical protein